MSKTVDIYFALASPFAYLGFQRFLNIANKHGARINFRPVALSKKIFPVTGGLPLAERPPARRAYRLVELQRWSSYLGVPLNENPAFFPVDDGLAACTAVGAREAGHDIGDFCYRVLRAVWADEKNIADPNTVCAIADEAGLDGAAAVAAAETDAAKAQYDKDTQEAIDRGVFGAPFFFYQDEPFWGQDRLDFLDRALAR